MTALQVKGSGIANTCPVIEGGSSNLKDLKPGSYKIQKFCMEPTSFKVKEESQFKGGDAEFAPTKLMTRLTYTLDEVRCFHRPALRDCSLAQLWLIVLISTALARRTCLIQRSTF